MIEGGGECCGQPSYRFEVFGSWKRTKESMKEEKNDTPFHKVMPRLDPTTEQCPKLVFQITHNLLREEVVSQLLGQRCHSTPTC